MRELNPRGETIASRTRRPRQRCVFLPGLILGVTGMVQRCRCGCVYRENMISVKLCIVGRFAASRHFERRVCPVTQDSSLHQSVSGVLTRIVHRLHRCTNRVRQKRFKLQLNLLSSNVSSAGVSGAQRRGEGGNLGAASSGAVATYLGCAKLRRKVCSS